MGTASNQLLDTEILAAEAGGGGAGGGGAGGGGGGGDLFADLYILLRDLDPTDGGGDGEPVLDGNAQTIPVGLDTTSGDTFPIYYVEVAEGDFEIPADQLPYVQEIVLERVNVIRAPDSVREHALEEALAKITSATSITTDFAGRIVADGTTIDAPNENLALYHLIMTAGGVNSWTEVLANAETNLPTQLVDLLASGWDPTGLLGGAASKATPFSMDAVLTAHSMAGVNEVTGSGDTLQIDYFSFTDGTAETYDYDRVERYGDMWVQWYQDMDGNPFNLEAVQRTVFDAVWGSDNDGDGVNDVGSGVNWVDEYITLSEDGLSFETFAATGAGINDWAQAVDDSRAVINFLHESVGGAQILPPADNVAASGDFNADGTADIALRNTATGALVNWQMSDSAVAQEIALGTAGLDWTVSGSGDFNGDGTADILFRNENSGWVLNWQMSNGATATSIDVGGAGLDWNLFGVGDFNGDGTDDILLRHETSGWLLDWTMENGAMSAESFVGGAGLDWDLVGIGDFNGDGTDDILLRHETSGWLLNWTMENGAMSAESFVGGAGLDWEVAGTGDVNGDGTDDILLRHDSGAVLNWEMSNGALSREVSVGGLDNDWALVATGDYNADGTDDVLFQNSGPNLAGQLMVWEMADGTLGAFVPVAAPASGLDLL
jgi:hypothetical protein